MEIKASQIAELRNKTSLPMMECKKALVEAGGDENKAIEILRKKGFSKAAEKSNRVTGSGLIDSYIHHNGKIGVLIEVLCETDFVAKNDDFKEFVHEVALHIAAANPKFINRKEIPSQVIEEEKNNFQKEDSLKNKPADIIEKIIAGKMEKYYQENCLMDQAYIKDEDKTIDELLKELIAKTGENIVISRFKRIELGK